MSNSILSTAPLVEGEHSEAVPEESKPASHFRENRPSRWVDTNSNEDEIMTGIRFRVTPTSAEFRSPRIESMILSRSEFASELEYRTAHSKVHWSELSEESSSSDGSGFGSRLGLGLDHRQYFAKLQRDALWGPFCNDVLDVVVGERLGEGAQADVYDAKVTFGGEGDPYDGRHEFVVKVMKGDSALEDLQRQWPEGLADFKDRKFGMFPFHLYGALVKEPHSERSKFGFVMRRFWGDLRSLIDLRMEERKGKGPPFSLPQVKHMMYWIAKDMHNLHGSNIIHRDLKSSNVLVSHTRKELDLVSSEERDWVCPYVADWECSVGVVGTRFWRAPEILVQLRDRVPSFELVFDEKVDVYSYAMTCYEIVTGRVPFEGLPNNLARDAVIAGERPELPRDLNEEIRNIIVSCWNPDPSLRPSFSQVVRM